MIYCGTCGTRLTPGDKFCSACGTAVAPVAEGEKSARGATVPPETRAHPPLASPAQPPPNETPVGHPGTPVGPPNTARTTRRGPRKWFIISIAAALVVLAGAGIAVWIQAQQIQALPSSGTVDVPTTAAPTEITSNDPSTPTSAEPTFDDPLIDPCGLVTVSDFTAFGQAKLKQADTFLDCDLVVQTSTASVKVSILITFNFYGPELDEKGVRVEDRGGIRVVRPEDAADCESSVVASDGSFVSFEGDDSSLDCSIVEAATDSAVRTFSAGSLPRLSYPTNSLAHIDACELILAGGPDRIGGGAGAVTQRTAGGHRCDWAGNTTAVTATLRLEDSSPAPFDARGRVTTLSGRSAVVQPYSSDSGCTVSVEHLRNQTGRIEVLDLEVRDNSPVESICAMATELATSMVSTLPPA